MRKILLLLVFIFAWNPDLFPQDTRMVVSSARDFLKAVASQRVLILDSGDYDISNLYKIYSSNVGWEGSGGTQDQPSLVFYDIRKLVVEGRPGCRILTKHCNVAVLQIRNCSAIVFRNITFLHEGQAAAGAFVLRLTDSDHVTFANCKFSGKGTQGVFARNCRNLSFESSRFSDCTVGFMSLYDCTETTFDKTVFENSCSSNCFNLCHSTGFSMNACRFASNYVANYCKYFILTDAGCSRMLIRNSQFTGNRSLYFAKDLSLFTFRNNSLEKNTFADWLW